MASASNKIRALEYVREWNQHFPVGTLVMFEGKEVATWSPAALGPRDQPCVFLFPEVSEEPVHLDRLEVPGWSRTGKKRNSKPTRE